MSNAGVRVIFAGVFAIVSLIGAMAMEIGGDGAPEWMIVTVTAAVTYTYAHVTANTSSIVNDVKRVLPGTGGE